MSSRRPSPRLVLLPVFLAVLVPALGACAPGDEEPGVASVQTDAGGGAGTGAAPTAAAGSLGADAGDRPVLRVDDTVERRRALWNPYLTCLLENGASEPPADGVGVALGDVLVDLPAPPEAQEACVHLEPLQPPALDASTNPAFAEDASAYVGCLQDRGLWVTLLTSNSLDWTYAEGHAVPDDVETIEHECLVASFGDQ